MNTRVGAGPRSPDVVGDGATTVEPPAGPDATGPLPASSGGRAPRWVPRRGRRLAAVVFALLVVAAVLGPAVAPDHSTIALRDRLQPPVGLGGTWEHPLGTDGLGRDMLAGLLVGARISLVVGVGATVLAAIVGVVLGMVAGYRGGVVDTLVGWVVDFQLAFPALLILLLVAAYIDAGLIPLVLTLAAISWMLFARMARALALSLRESEFVAAAKLAGSGSSKILFRHLLPSMLSPLLTVALLHMATLMLAEAGASYLGLGIQRPDTSWGLMIAEGQEFLRVAWWIAIFPGVLLAVAVFALNILARSARQDPGDLRPQI